MARVSGKDAIKKAVKEYGGSGVGFFSLKADGEKATVRFLHTDDGDLDIYVVHSVEVDGKDTYVECLQGPECPLCIAGNKAQLKVFFSLYDIKEDKTLVWDRGPGIIDQMLGLIEKYGYLNNRPYEIQRHGKPGDKKTSYQLFPEDKSEPLGADGKLLPKRPDIIGRFVQSWTEEQMGVYINQGNDVTKQRQVKGEAATRKGPGF